MEKTASSAHFSGMSMTAALLLAAAVTPTASRTEAPVRAQEVAVAHARIIQAVRIPVGQVVVRAAGAQVRRGVVEFQ